MPVSSAKVTQVLYLLMTSNISIDSNLTESPEIASLDLQKLKTWTKPTLRVIEFKVTAGGSGGTGDSYKPS
jgi:hypothetical protein